MISLDLKLVRDMIYYSGVKKILNIILILLSMASFFALLLKFTGYPTFGLFGASTQAGLEVTSQPAARVILNNQEVGETPYKNNNLIEGRYDLQLKYGNTEWQGEVKLVRGMVTVVSRELTGGEVLSGEVLILERGRTGAVITSSPIGANVDIDGKPYGSTPLSVFSLSSGEHTFTIRKDQHKPRSIKALMPENLTLNIDFNLAPVEQAVLPPEPTLRARKVEVQSTPVGFLRVRSEPSTISSEIDQVKIGAELEFLSEEDEWIKVRLEDGTEGYVHSAYIKKLF